jgi:hypothetical protein
MRETLLLRADGLERAVRRSRRADRRDVDYWNYVKAWNRPQAGKA